MKRLTLLVIILSSFSVETVYAMDDQEKQAIKNIMSCPPEQHIFEHYDQEGLKLQAELQELLEKNKKSDDDYLSQVEKWGHRQLEHVENEKRKNEALRRSCSFFIYSMTGIGIVVVGILLYQICKKPKTDKE